MFRYFFDDFPFRAPRYVSFKHQQQHQQQRKEQQQQQHHQQQRKEQQNKKLKRNFHFFFTKVGNGGDGRAWSRDLMVGNFRQNQVSISSLAFGFNSLVNDFTPFLTPLTPQKNNTNGEKDHSSSV